VIPAIFASLLTSADDRPVHGAGVAPSSRTAPAPSHEVYVGLIVFFAYFYTAVMINPVDVAENIKKSGAYIPGIRPGKKTAEHIDACWGGSRCRRPTCRVCVLPVLLTARFGIPFYFGGTALLIVVGVSLDTIGQIEAHLVSRQYEGFVKGTRLRGRLGR
jgi:preprotein translocase subunit SecY